MTYTYKGLFIDLPYKIEQIEDISLTETINDHIHVHIKALVPENKIDEYIQENTENSTIVVYQYNEELKKNEIVFQGYILNLKMDYYRNLNMLEIEAVSFTCQWDIKKKKRSFQNLDLSYEDLIYEVLKAYPKSDWIDMVTQGKYIRDLIVQYEETDWEFLKRIATHFGTVLIPEGTTSQGRIFFGVPKTESCTILKNENYEIIKDLETCNKYDFMIEQDCISWLIKGSRKLYLGEKVIWQNIKCVITKVILNIVNEELQYIYTLKPYNSIKTKYKYNSIISGMSMAAVIKEVQGNSVRVHFDIDDKYNGEGNNKFFTYALESSAWYCMPIQGSKINIYFPTRDEKDAIAVNAIRSSSNGSKISNPRCKSFSNDCGSEMKMDGQAITYSTGGVNVSLNESGNIEVSGDTIILNASGNLQLGIKETGEGQESFIPNKITASSKEGIYLSKSAVNGVDDALAISIVDKTNLIGTNIIDTATVKNPPAVTFDDSKLKAEDAKILQKYNQQAQIQLEKKLQEGKSKFGFGTIILTVGAVAVFAAATVLTGGATAVVATVGSTAATGLGVTGLVAGGTAAAVGASEMSEGSSDYTKAQSGDMSKSYNFMRDTVCGGNETLYKVTKYGSVCISAGVSIVAFGGEGALAKAIGDGGFRTGFNVVGDLLDDGKINRGFEYYVKDVTLSMTTGAMTAKFNKIVGAKDLNCKQKFIANSLIDSSADNVYQFGCGEDITPIKNAACSALTNLIFSADPVNVANGSLHIPATDLVFSDIHGELKLQRNYNSVLNRTGVLGKAWTFAYESKLQRKDKNTLLMLCTDGHVETFELKDNIWQNTKGNSLKYEIKYDEVYSEWKCTNNPEKLTYVYNSTGLLIRIVDKNNNKLTIDYEGENIKTLTTFSGHVLKFICENGKIVEIQDTAGRKIQYRYDGDYLTHVCHVDHGITTYNYNEQGYISAIKDQNGNTYTKNYFDNKGRVVYQEYPNGTGCKISYDDDNRESEFYFTGSERLEKYRYNEKNLITHIFYQNGTFVEYKYDEHENRVIEIDRNSNVTEKSFDIYGNLEREKSPQGNITKYTYDKNQNLIKKEDNAGREILYSYDDKGNIIEEKVKVEVDRWQSSKYQHDIYGRITKITDSLNNNTTYEYTVEGLILPEANIVKDAEENVYSYEYDEIGRNTAITTDYGTVEFGYNTLNYITLIQDGNGNITRKYYDKMGNLVRAVMPNDYNASYDNGVAYEYRYDFFDKLVEIKDPLGNVNRNIRDSQGNIKKEINPNYYNAASKDGIGIEYIYDKDNRKIKTIYPDGGVERLFYDANGNIIKRVAPEYYNLDTDDGIGFSYSYDSGNRLTSITAPDGTVEKRYVYDSLDNIIEEIDAKGYTTYYKYNLIGQIIEKREPVEEDTEGILYNLTLFIYDENGNKITERHGKEFTRETDYPIYYHEIHFDYDKNNRLIKVRDNNGAKIQYGYDCLNNKTYECARINDDNYRRIHYKYDRAGNLIEKKEEINGKDISKENIGKALWAITKFTYDKNGNIIAMKTPKGYTIKRSYDKIDRITVEEKIDKENDICRKNTYSYDKIGNILKIEDTNNNTKCYTYDSKNRLTHFINENGNTTRLCYDKNDRIIKEILPEQYDPNVDDGKGTTITYDAWDRAVEVRNPLGQLTKKNIYDTLGNIKSSIDGANHKVDFTYTIAGKMKEIITPNSREKGKAAQKYIYDSRGNITGISDGNDNETSYKLDDWGRIVEIIHPDGTVEEYTYDYAGNITSTRDGNGNIITYGYNSLNKLSEIKDQEGNSEYFYYDKEGNQVESIDRNGNQIFYGYNIDKNITFRKDNSGSLWESFDYNKDGTLKMAKTSGMAYSYNYTKDLRLKSKATCGRTLLSYEYDKNGNTIGIEDISGKSTRYSYDIANRVEKVFDKDKTLAAYSYNSDDTIKEISYGNGVITNYSYDGDKNIRSLITQTSKGEILIDYNYAYDLNGNRLQKVGSKNQSYYTYDSLNRLSSAKYNTPTKSLEESFTYDKAGNRLTRTTNSGIERYKYNAKNQLVELQKANGITKYNYDKQGNLTQEIHPEGINTYNYNSFNQTVKAETKEGNTLVSRYDAEGLRYEIEENDRLTKFIFNKDNIIAELDKDNNVKVRLSRGYEIVSTQIEETRYYYHQEEQGSTAYITDNAEAVQNSYFYDVFGVVLEEKEQVHNRFKYVGEQYDAVTNQYYLRARFYNPVIGRFLQEDIYRGDGLDLYSYCHNNPVGYYDPSGYMCSPKKNQNSAGGAGRAGVGIEGTGKADFIAASGGVIYKADDYANMVVKESDGINRLYHYTNDKGLNGILESGQLNPSIKAFNPKDARYGNGQYLSDVVPGEKTLGQLSHKFLNVPWAGKKFTNCIEIDVSGLNMIKGRDGVYLIPNEEPLDITNRIINYGKSTK